MHSHSHDHQHDHSHAGHHHAQPGDVPMGAFVAGMLLNGGYVAVQAVMGFATHSVALLSDAGHNLGDVATLALSLIAFRLAKSKPTQSFTYGYKKTTIMSALVNAVLLLVTIGVLGYESVIRLLHPQPVQGGTVAIVAAIGIAVNMGTALLFFRSREHDLNAKGAYLHMLTDALVSLGVVVAGIVIKYTGWYWMDGAVSIIVLAVILAGTWGLLTDSLRMSLDAVPAGIEAGEVARVITSVKGVDNLHHLHIWAMSTTENALTAHLVLSDTLTFDEKMKLVSSIKHTLLHNNIQHATIEVESAATPCTDADC